MKTEPSSIAALVERLTLDQKVRLVSGASLWRTNPIPELGIPVLKVSDGPNGVRGDGGASAASFPVGICMGATWNPDLIKTLGVAIAEEAKTKEVQVVLGPTINLHRTPLGGRNFECYAEDPILSGELAAAFTEGGQSQGVGACLKHFVCNDSEFERHTISVEVDEQTLREVYLLPFQIAIEKSTLTVSGIDKELVGAFTSKIRSQKKPEPYKGKGIRYEGEKVRRKQGKKAV